MTEIPTRSRAPRPPDLYSNSTVALDPATGKLAWYYQHLPGDDWDSDYTHERTLVRTRLNPDPKFVKWINPDIPRGQERDVAVTVGEAGGIFVLDRATGQFLWAEPFPFDDPNFVISDIDREDRQDFHQLGQRVQARPASTTWSATGTRAATGPLRISPATIRCTFLHR